MKFNSHGISERALGQYRAFFREQSKASVDVTDILPVNIKERINEKSSKI